MSGEAQTAAQRAGDGLMSSRVRRAGAKRIQSLGEPTWLMSCPGALEGQFSRLYTLMRMRRGRVKDGGVYLYVVALGLSQLVLIRFR